MDINMPLMNGFETTKEYVKRHNHACIIALTTFDKEEILKRRFLLECDIIIKP
jgi:DNA-binding NarL/FixJ family response regulator